MTTETSAMDILAEAVGATTADEAKRIREMAAEAADSDTGTRKRPFFRDPIQQKKKILQV